jgi:addiction module RelE/StbE family toxin
MEKEIVWTTQAEKDFWDIVFYLKDCWPPSVLENFENKLSAKTSLLQKQPHIGFKSKKYSRFRRTLVTKHYVLIYSVKEHHIVILRLKHVRLKSG